MSLMFVYNYVHKVGNSDSKSTLPPQCSKVAIKGTVL